MNYMLTPPPGKYEWSRDWWRHVTQKDQGRDPNIFEGHYLDNGWRYGLGAPIGNVPLGFEWSRDWWRHVTQKGQGRDPNMLNDKHLENGWW